MNADSFYLLLLSYMSGIATCALLACSIFIFRHHHKYFFQKVFATVLIIHAVGFTNNFVVAAGSEVAYSDFLNTLLLLFDYVIVGGYMAFALALVFPNRFSPWKLLLVELPFIAAMIAFAITQSEVIYPIVQIFTPVASLLLFILLEYSIKRHTHILKDNVGNIEHYDLRWSSIFIALLFVLQCFWVGESISQKTWFSSDHIHANLLFDTGWCLICILLVALAMRKIVQQEVFSVPSETEGDIICQQNTNKEPIEGEVSDSSENSAYHQVLSDKNIESIIWGQQYYADKTLTLQRLASLLGTNRQYLSNYINQEQHKTFYEYINDFRLQAAKSLLDNRASSIEEAADQAGFNSYATFLRSFRKRYGQTPSNYLKSINPKT